MPTVPYLLAYARCHCSQLWEVALRFNIGHCPLCHQQPKVIEGTYHPYDADVTPFRGQVVLDAKSRRVSARSR